MIAATLKHGLGYELENLLALDRQFLHLGSCRETGGHRAQDGPGKDRGVKRSREAGEMHAELLRAILIFSPAS
ncbi:MAG: hypothetical protein AMXMBFR7_18160 [Planctomycetota bacterium]